MFCENCGNKLADGIKFCPVCGTKVTVVAPAVEEVVPEAVPETVSEVVPAEEPPIGMPPVAHLVPDEVPQPTETVVTSAPAAKKANSTGALVLGILGLVFSESGLIGLILSIIGYVKSNKFMIINGKHDGKSKTGKILSLIGIIFSIISTVIIIAVGALVAVAVSSGAADDLLRSIAGGGEIIF